MKKKRELWCGKMYSRHLFWNGATWLHGAKETGLVRSAGANGRPFDRVQAFETGLMSNQISWIDDLKAELFIMGLTKS